MFYQLDIAGHHKGLVSYDVRTKEGAFVAVIADRPNGTVRVYFNSTATRFSKRQFASRQHALDFIHERRAKKGRA